MISYSCDWCGAKKSGYEINNLMPRPAWHSRPHPAEVGEHDHGQSEVIACSRTCAMNIDAALNVPYFVRRWIVSSATSEDDALFVRTDMTRPIIPLPEEPVALHEGYRARYK